MIRALPAVWAACVVALSTLPLTAAYAAWWALPVLIACVVVPFVLVSLGRRLGLSPVWIALGGGALALVAGASLADHGIAADPAWWRSSAGTSWIGALADAVPRLLTAPRPAPAEIGYLVPAALFTWIVALGVALATTPRGRSRVGPLVGAIVLQTAGALVTAGAADASGLIAAATVAVLLLGWVTLPSGEQTHRKRRVKTTRSVWVASAVAAVVVGALALPGAALTGGARFEPRTLVPPPHLPAQASNPLPNVALWNDRSDDVLFTLTATAEPERIRLAVLPDFDGAAWTLDGSLRGVGVVDSPDLPVGHWEHRVTYRFTPGDLIGAWVPSLGRAVKVDSSHIVMDTDTGTLVDATGRADDAVTVTATVNDPTDDAIARAGVPPQQEASRYLKLPRVPSELTAQAADLTQGAPSRWDQVTALAEYVRGDRTLDQGAASGSSYGRIEEFLFEKKSDGGQVGTTEQFAASFAVLARAVGIPTRLVVGFVPDDGETTDGATTVTGADARVWAEVYLSRAGWVTVDPSPDSAVKTPHTPIDDQDQERQPTSAPSPTPTAAQDSAPDAAAPHDSSASAATGVSVTVGVLVLLVVLLTGGLVAARVRRRLAWRAAGPTGAWAQTLDAADLSGRTPDAAAAPERVAAELAAAAELDEADADRLQGVAARAQAAAYAPDGDAAAQGDDWATTVAVERSLRRRSTWWRRMLWHVTPRILRRR